MNETKELINLIEKIPKNQILAVKQFLLSLIDKHTEETAEFKLSKKDKYKISLHGITSGSMIKDEDIEEAKKIWQSQ